ncbi:MAG: hypothetical protein M0Z99_22085 [Betaproteobacteria bacterium]|nr:hypothetical protein [Betaproteobacteria bacterium]
MASQEFDAVQAICDQPSSVLFHHTEDAAQMTIDDMLDGPPPLRDAALIVLAHVAVALNRRVSAAASKRCEAARDPWRIPVPGLRERLLLRAAVATQNAMLRIARASPADE